MQVREDASVVSGDFWYDFFDGGYIQPEALLEDSQDIAAVLAAKETLMEFRKSLHSAGVVEEI